MTNKMMPPAISSVYRANIVRTMPVEFGSKHDCPADVSPNLGESLARGLDVRAVYVQLSERAEVVAPSAAKTDLLHPRASDLRSLSVVAGVFP
jgi:hypothetical protein